MSHYKPYPAYRDSGVEWIGQVPAHWRVSAVKREFSTQLGKMLQPELKNPLDIPVPYHKAVSVQWERVADTPPEIMWASPSELEQFRVRKGDLLICEGGDVGRAALFEGEDSEPIIIQNSIHRVRARDGNDNEMLLRVMQTVKRSGWFEVLCSKSTIVHFTSEKLGDLAYPVPPGEESKAIVSAVRRETTRIDALITKKTRFIELLKEKRQALITHAVTNGLDPNVKMKDSGVEWLGEVPAHWQIKPLWSVFKPIKRTGFVNEQLLSVYRDYGVIPKSSRDDNRNRASDDLSPYQLVEPDNLVTNKMKTWQGSIAVSEHRGIVSPAYFVYEAIEPLFGRFIHHLMRSSPYITGYMSISKGIRVGQWDLDQEHFRVFPILFPSLIEQKAIVKTLDSETARIDLVITKTQRSIDLLKERRAAFITAAVTGQIDLRESA